MIRLTCPTCEKTLSVADAAAGKTGKCPGCGTRFTVPAAPAAPPGRPPAPDPDDDERPARSRRTVADDDDEDEDDAPRPKRKKKKRKAAARGGVLGWFSGFPAIVAGIAVMTLVLAILSLVIQSGAAFALLMGWGVLLSVAGGVWFAVVTIQDSVTEFLLCLFVPFYSLYYLVTHFDDVKRPFFVQLLSVVPMLIAAAVVAKRGFVVQV